MDSSLQGQQQVHMTVLLYITALTMLGGLYPLACVPPLA